MSLKISTREDGALVVTHFGTVFLAFGCAFLALGAFIFQSPEGMEKPVLTAVCFGLLTAVALLSVERNRFVFCPRRKRVEWRRALPLKRASGTVAFSDIEAVQIERGMMTGSRGGMYRLALVTRKGRIPFTAAFSGNRTPLESAGRAIHALLADQTPVEFHR